MKTRSALITILLVFFISASYAWYDDYGVAGSEKESKPESLCPISKISDNNKCLNCHAMILKDGKPTFGLKEINPADNYDPPGKTKIITNKGKLVPYLEINGTDSDQFKYLDDYTSWHPEFKRVIIEMFSPGGSVIDAWRSVGYIKKMQSRGIIVEMHCYGLAASAGAILLIAGDIGHRYVSPHAEIMLHKVWTFKMFSIETPDSAEDQADILKHFQNNINDFILGRTKISRDLLDQSMFKKDFWMTGRQAVEDYGLADQLI